MKKISDERLVLKNLQNIKITYIVQTIGILSILGYELAQGGLEGMRQNPLWLVFMLTTVVYTYLSMSVSVDHETKMKHPKKSLIISVIVLSIIALAIGYFTSITPSFGWGDGVLIGAILFICGLIPCYYVYRLRHKQQVDLEDDE
jgi:tellurite resistance protein TehA-like permease